jgi:hypothetical protein
MRGGDRDRHDGEAQFGKSGTDPTRLIGTA